MEGAAAKGEEIMVAAVEIGGVVGEGGEVEGVEGVVGVHERTSRRGDVRWTSVNKKPAPTAYPSQGKGSVWKLKRQEVREVAILNGEPPASRVLVYATTCGGL